MAARTRRGVLPGATGSGTTGSHRRHRLAALLGASLLAGLPASASAFEIFGFRFFEPDPVEEPLDPDAVPYTAELTVRADPDIAEDVRADIEDDLSDTSALVRDQDDPPLGLVGLVARARADRRNLVGALYGQARYGGVVAVEIDGRPLPEISVGDDSVVGAGAVPVSIAVEPGPVFTFGQVDLGPAGDTVDPGLIGARAGLVPGAPAESPKIGATQSGLVAAWRGAGHPFAAPDVREIVADHATNLLDVRIAIAPGPLAVFGDPTVSGTDRLIPSFVEYMADIPVGATYDPDELRAAARRLRALPALASVSIQEGEALQGGALPLDIQVSERKPRVIGAGIQYDSTEGLGVSTYWQHRNLFGRAETLRLEAEIARIGEAGETRDHDAKLAARFTKPGLINPYTRLEASFALLQENPDAYSLQGVFADAFLISDITKRLTLRGGLEASYSEIEDAFGTRTYGLVGLPVSAAYDARDDRLDPARGYRLNLEVSPYLDVERSTPFARTDLEATAYLGLGRFKGGRFGTAEVDERLLAERPPRIVLAARAAAGAVLGVDGVLDVPTDKRFYAGGGGSVRGYGFRNIGPREPISDKVFGGLARIEGSLEARIRVTEAIGVVPFIDAGAVSETLDDLDFTEIKVGVGLGVRYRTPVGPIRLDIGVPLDPEENDPPVGLYVGIGQAF
ncbi:MAG: autotransporter assembly complex family protein [Pseudomonadota bacterium]